MIRAFTRNSILCEAFLSPKRVSESVFDCGAVLESVRADKCSAAMQSASCAASSC